MKKITSAVAVLLFSLCLMVATLTTASAASVAKVKELEAATTPTSVTLSWEKVSGASGYYVQQYSGKKWKTVKTIKKAGTTSAKITKLKINNTYKFRVCAYKGKKKGAYVTVKAKTATEKTTGLKVTAAGLKKLELNWNKVTGASGYEVQQKNGKKWKTVKTVKKNTVSISGLGAAQKYTYRVRAYVTVNGVKRYGAYSASASGKTAVAQITTLKVKSTAATTVTLSWKKISGATGYEIQKKEGKKWVNVSTSVGKSKTSYTVKNLTGVTSYTFRIRAKQKSGSKTYYGAWSSAVKATTKLGVVTSLSYSSLKGTSAKLSWNKASGAKGYTVYQNGKKLKDVTGTSLTLSLKNGTEYKYKVVSYNGSLRGTSTKKQVTFTTPVANVKGAKLSSVGEDSFKLSWSEVTGAKGYDVEYRLNGGSWKTATTTSKSYTAKNLTPGAYEMRVRAYNYNGSNKQASSYSTLKANIGTCIYNGTLYWTAVSGASKYTVEKYNLNTYTWSAEATVSTTSHKIKDGTALYRVVAKNSSDKILNTTAMLSTKVTGLNVAFDGAKLSLAWDKVSGATSYQLTILSDGITDMDAATVVNLKSSDTSCVQYVAPGLTYTIRFSALKGSANTLLYAGKITASELTVNNTAESKNAQLLYLVEAINRAKYDTSVKTSASYRSTSVNSIDALEMDISGNVLFAGLFTTMFGDLKGDHDVSYGHIECRDVTAVKSFCDIMNKDVTNEADKMLQSETTTTLKVGSFSAGENTCLNGAGTRTYSLSEFVGPPTQNAYLYNGNNPSAWSNGFSSVTTTKNSNGTITIVAVAKKESNTKYHDGLTDTFASSSGSFSGMDIKSSSAGPTTLTAVIDSKCRISSLQVDSAYDVSVALSMDESSIDLNMSMKMDMSGTTSATHTFIRYGE